MKDDFKQLHESMKEEIATRKKMLAAKDMEIERLTKSKAMDLMIL